jgi:hypothetical protein
MTSMEYSYQPERANWFTKFLWHSAGADGQILLKCPKSDQVKYECLGGLVLSTSVLAFMSGSYAVYVAFSRKDIDALDNVSLAAALIVGLFWSLLIYNLERFIVSSMGKVDESGAITFAKLWRAFPRVALSVIVGIVLASPLEVRVLENEVKQIVSQRQAVAMVELERRYADARSEKNRIADFRSRLPNNELAKVELTIIALQQKINEKESNFDAITAARSQNRRQDLSPHLLQLTGSLQTTQQLASLKRDTERDLVKWQDKLKFAISKRTLLEKNQTLVNEVNNVKAEFKKSTQREYEKQVSALKNESGLFRQLAIIHSDSQLSGISFFLKLLLIIIETSPVFFKMMVSRSTYEVLLDSQQRISSAQQGVLRGGLVTLDGRLVPTSEMSIAASAYEAELRRRSETEARLADEVHRVVRERTAEEIREHPEDYYSRYGSVAPGTGHSARTGSSPAYTAHTSGHDPLDPFGRRYVDRPSGSDPATGPGGDEPGMGYVGTGGTPLGTTAEPIRFTTSTEFERFTDGATIVEPLVLRPEAGSESAERDSSETSSVTGTEATSTTLGDAIVSHPPTIDAGGTISMSETVTDPGAISPVVDSSSESSDSAVAHETVAPPTVTADTSDEHLGHEGVVSPPLVSVDDSEGEFTVSDFVSADASTARSVDSYSVVDGVDPVTSGSIDNSVTTVDAETGFDSSADVTSVGSMDESAVVELPEPSVSGPLNGVIWSEGELPTAELLLTTVRTEDFPVDDTQAEYPDTDVDPDTTRTPDTHEPASE